MWISSRHLLSKEGQQLVQSHTPVLGAVSERILPLVPMLRVISSIRTMMRVKEEPEFLTLWLCLLLSCLP